MNLRRSAVTIGAVAGMVTGCAAALLVPATAAQAGYGGASNSYSQHSLCAPPADTVGPVVNQVTFGRSSIDLNSGSRAQTVTAAASDTSGAGDPSGVSQVTVIIRGNRYATAVRLSRTAGTAASGTWSGRFTLSKYAQPGTYSIEDINVSDAAGNAQTYSGYDKTAQSPAALSLHPADNPTFAVTGTPPPPPTRTPAGTLHAFAFAPAQVDTTAAPRRIRVTARFTSPAPRRVSVEFLSVKRAGISRFVFLRAVLRHHPDGWSGFVRIPRWLGDQTLQPYLYAAFGQHHRPSYRSYDPDRLHRLHFANQLKVVSGVDKAKPALTSLSFSPSTIDSTSGPVHVTVTAHATDVGSGVRAVYVNGGIRHGVNGVAAGSYPNAAAGIGYLSSNYFHVRLTKSAGGAWVGTMKIRQCVPSGAYKLTAELRDVAGNYRFYSTKGLGNAQLPSRVQVTSKHGDVEAPYILGSATYAPTHTITVNFSEGVANVSDSTLHVYALAPAGSRFQSPMKISSISCAHEATEVPDCSGSSGLITSAVLTVQDMQPNQRYDVFANLDQVTTQLVDGNGNPMDWNYAATEVKD